MPLFGPLSDLCVDRKRKVHTLRRADQWPQLPGTTALVPVWVRGQSFRQMRFGDKVGTEWLPQMEQLTSAAPPDLPKEQPSS